MPALDRPLHHVQDLCLFLLDPWVLPVLLETGRVLVLAEFVLVENPVLVGLADLGEFGPEGNFEILLGGSSLLLDADSLSVGEAGGEHLVLDLAKDLLGLVEGERLGLGLLSAGEVVDGEVEEAEGPSRDQVLPEVLVLFCLHC